MLENIFMKKIEKKQQRRFSSEQVFEENMSSLLPRKRLKTEVDSKSDNYYRVAVLGGGGVGKSSIIDRLVKNCFNVEHVLTVSEVYEIELKRKEKTLATLCLYDTSGSISFPVMNKLTISKSDACIIVYAVDSKKSLLEAERKFSEIKDVKGDSFPCVLVGNKKDLANREVTFDRGLRCAVKYGASYLETSAKNDVNIKDGFETVVKKIKHVEIFKMKILNDKKKVEKSFSSRRNLSISKYFM